MADSSAHISIDPSVALEEETVRGCKAEHYYPVPIGDVFQDRSDTDPIQSFGSAMTCAIRNDTSRSMFTSIARNYMDMFMDEWLLANLILEERVFARSRQ